MACGWVGGWVCVGHGDGGGGAGHTWVTGSGMPLSQNVYSPLPLIAICTWAQAGWGGVGGRRPGGGGWGEVVGSMQMTHALCCCCCRPATPTPSSSLFLNTQPAALKTRPPSPPRAVRRSCQPGRPHAAHAAVRATCGAPTTHAHAHAADGAMEPCLFGSQSCLAAELCAANQSSNQAARLLANRPASRCHPGACGCP